MNDGGGWSSGNGKLLPTDRGISPGIGVLLLLGIVFLLAAITASIFLSIGEEPDPTPNVVLDLEEAEHPPVHLLRHEGGDDLGGNGRTEVRGIADPQILHDEELTAGDGREVIPVVPIDEEVKVIWYGEDDTSYVLWRFEPSSYLPVSPDEDCGWVKAETNNGTDDIDVDGVVVNCDIITEGDVVVLNDAVIVGNTTSIQNSVDLDESAVYGPVLSDGDVDLDGTNVSESVESTGDGDIDLTDGSNVGGDVRTGAGGNVDMDGGSSVDGDVEAGGDVDVDSATVGGDLVSSGGDGDIVLTGGSNVDGDVRTGADGSVDIDGGSSVDGDVEAGGDVSVDSATIEGDVVISGGDGDVALDNVTVSGHVYVDSGDFSCSDSTINGEDCGTYTPKDPDD
jgi:flagellin-like protein